MSEEEKRGRGRPRKRHKERNYQQITVHLDPALIERLDAHAEAEDFPSRSDLIRTFCEEGLRRAAKRAAREGS
jgi:metal-responsive CopG/Arc/MetJ family transcriptional regulator